MTWKDDVHGLLCSAREIKCYLPSHSWAMKLSQMARQDALIRIATYSLNAEFAIGILQRRPYSVRLACHQQFVQQARILTSRLPGVKVKAIRDLHAKLVLIEPDTTYLGSANFVPASISDLVIGIRSRAVHAHYAQWFDAQWAREAPVRTRLASHWPSEGCYAQKE
jgi:phosphatidylserine/phosphatidylglycerophosphate/cardiolipin synthase-like enzyme